MSYRKLNTFTYLTVNCVCIFAHKCYKICGKVSRLASSTDAGGVHHHDPVCAPELDVVDNTLSVTFLCVFIDILFRQLGKLLSLTFVRPGTRYCIKT